MAPYFETVKSFVDVPITDAGVETVSFLEASDGLLKMFDLFGSGVFGFVQADIRGNIQGVRSRFESSKEHSDTLEHLVEQEAKENQRNAIGCLIRLVRGHAFICKALQNAQSSTTSELHICFKQAYDVVLRHHHGFVVRNVVSVAIRAVPRRTDFYNRIAQGGSREKLDVEMNKWLEALEVIVKRMSSFLEGGGYGKV
ncbi:hypothetical protein AAF712_014400 [Marasmius tenuissimus]|uniref:Glycolipid transfer protein domain-containing protein n=1 Tax=Marasmius tenuissimus TaxID=585030 RepID=A0ABR2ZEM5_9AGAR